jgi:hypothetical protein
MLQEQLDNSVRLVAPIFQHGITVIVAQSQMVHHGEPKQLKTMIVVRNSFSDQTFSSYKSNSGMLAITDRSRPWSDKRRCNGFVTSLEGGQNEVTQVDREL